MRPIVAERCPFTPLKDKGHHLALAVAMAKEIFTTLSPCRDMVDNKAY
jgi:hypothetical protein